MKFGIQDGLTTLVGVTFEDSEDFPNVRTYICIFITCGIPLRMYVGTLPRQLSHAPVV